VNTDINNDGNRRNDYAPGTTRNQFTLPSIVTLDPRIARDIPAGRAKLQLIFEGFNLLNADNFASVYTPAPPAFGQVFKYTVSGTNLTPNPTFGQFTYSAGPRILQLAIKVAF
jgi:hypothetical protein